MRGTSHQVIHHLVAALISDGGHHHGNGRHNRNVISEASPTHNHGYQHTNNGNSGGTNPTQNALCRHVTVCNVTQKVIVVVPSRPERPAPEQPAPAVAPAGVPAQPPVQVLPQTLVAQSRPRPAPPARPVRLRGPFLYMGPSGFLLMGSDSSAFGVG
jgi:hypothetical protein